MNKLRFIVTRAVKAIVECPSRSISSPKIAHLQPSLQHASSLRQVLGGITPACIGTAAGESAWKGVAVSYPGIEVTCHSWVQKLQGRDAESRVIYRDDTATPTPRCLVDFCPMALFLAHRSNSQLAVHSHDQLFRLGDEYEATALDVRFSALVEQRTVLHMGYFTPPVL